MLRVTVKVWYTYKVNRKEYDHEFCIYVKEATQEQVEKEVNAFYSELAERNPLEGLRVIKKIDIKKQTQI